MSDAQGWPALTSDDSTRWVMWRSGADSENTISLASLDDSLGEVDRREVTTHATWYSSPSIQWAGDHFGAAWSAFSTGPFPYEQGAWFAPLDERGTRTAFGSAVSAWGDCFCVPAIAFNGSLWGVATENDGFTADQNGYAIGFALVGRDGVSAQEASLISSPTVPADNPSLLWTGSGFVAGWSNGDRSGSLLTMTSTGGPIRRSHIEEADHLAMSHRDGDLFVTVTFDGMMRVARYASDLTVLDPFVPLAIQNGSRRIVQTITPAGLWVFWSEQNPGKLRATRVQCSDS
ncbi:MAG: hypothetical protein IPK13_07860 [Deltaproteobacteria bacterium]|nr:hypothetical protein [Deltaproteobacteria bacterium]